MGKPVGSARCTGGPSPIMVRFETSGYSSDPCFGRQLIQAVEPFSKPSAERLRAILLRPTNGADTVKPALWRVNPGQVEVVTLVPTPEVHVRPETLERLSSVEEVLREISWVLIVMRVAKEYRFCCTVDLASARITAAAQRRLTEDGVKVRDLTRSHHRQAR